jgi:hypothetical protein
MDKIVSNFFDQIIADIQNLRAMVSSIDYAFVFDDKKDLRFACSCFSRSIFSLSGFGASKNDKSEYEKQLQVKRKSFYHQRRMHNQ